MSTAAKVRDVIKMTNVLRDLVKATPPSKAEAEEALEEIVELGWAAGHLEQALEEVIAGGPVQRPDGHVIQ